MKTLLAPRWPQSAVLSLLIACGIFCGATPGFGQQFRLPDMGSTADTVMSSAAERRLGKAFIRSVRAQLPVIDDPMLTSYLDSLGHRLAVASGTTGTTYTFFLIGQPVINAFAGPGGYVGVFIGLVLATESESELAAVIAHEMGHIKQRHIMRSIEDSERLSLPATALLVAAAILGAQVNPQAGAAAVAGVSGLIAQHQINFTRADEEEADRVGIATLEAAGFDPYAMAAFFERLSKVSQVSESDAPAFLQDHPVNSARIADALGRAESYGGHRQHPDNLGYHLLRAQLRERSYTDPKDAVDYFRSTLGSRRFRNETAERFGYALALERSGNSAAAIQEVGRLLAKEPQRVEFIVLDAELEGKSGKRSEALAKLATAVDVRPDNLPLRVAYAKMLMNGGQAAKALRTLEEIARMRPATPYLYQLMSDAGRMAGEKGATHLYRAEYLYAQGDLEPAIRQLEFALTQRGINFQDQSRIQARLDAMKEEQKDLKKSK
jgi:beta-barrel assembly-enhancing protease